MVHRIAWIAASAVLAGALSAWACTVTNADHCGNRQGDATCQELYQAGVCSVCAVANNGCIDGPVPEGCAPEGTTSGHETIGTAPSTSTSTSTSMSTSSDPTATSANTGSTTSGSTTNDSGATTTTGGPAGVCQDGTRDPGELCDQDDLGDWTCEDFGGASGVPECNDDCTLDTRPCMSRDAECGNGMLEPGEQCDPKARQEFGDNDCETATDGQASGGMLACIGECIMTTDACCITEGTLCADLTGPSEFACCGDLECRTDGLDLAQRCRTPA